MKTKEQPPTGWELAWTISFLLLWGTFTFFLYFTYLEFPDPLDEPTREQVKRTKYWCWECSRSLLGHRGECPTCGYKVNPKQPIEIYVTPPPNFHQDIEELRNYDDF